MIKHKKWLLKNTSSLEGKTVALTGSTGGIGNELCNYLCFLGAGLILIDRNRQKAEKLKEKLTALYPDCKITLLTADLENIASVKAVTEELKALNPDVFIHNAGAYSIPRKICSTKFDNVFQINFVSPYYIIRELLPSLEKKGGRVVVVGSIAHRYSKTDTKDVDFKTCKKASLVYGNAKRYLMFSVSKLAESHPGAKFSVVHPGITFTGITAHYPKLIFALIKHPMKVIFMKPCTAALSVLRGIFKETQNGFWIGPKSFDVWGKPKLCRLKTDPEEQAQIAKTAEEIYSNL